MRPLTLTIAAFLSLFTFDPATPLAQATTPERAVIEGGRRRVKEFCAEHLAKGNYFPGCPAARR